MYRMIKQLLTNARGATLLELLAVLIISLMIVFLSGSVIVNATKAYEKTKIETELRDEADLILSKLIKDMFPLKGSEIIEVQKDTCTAETTSCEPFHWILLKDGRKLGFQGDKIILLDEVYTVQNQQLELVDSFSITQPDPSTTNNVFYEISFELRHKTKDAAITFNNTFGTLQ